MTTDNTGQPDNTDPDNIDPIDPPDNGGQDPDNEDADAWTPPDKAAWEKLSEKAKVRDQKLREAQAEIRKLKSPDSKDADPDPVSVANARLVRAEAKTALTAVGVAKDDLPAVLEVLNLSGIEVDEDGEVDTDALESAVENLRRIFGGTAPEKKRAPKLVTRDRGGSDNKPADPDASRYASFLGHSRV